MKLKITANPIIDRPLLAMTLLISSMGTAQAYNGFNFNDCDNDWPEWTPMYWMEEMLGNNDNCYPGAYGGLPAYLAYSRNYPLTHNPFMANNRANVYAASYPNNLSRYYGAYPQSNYNPYAAALLASQRNALLRKTGISPYTAFNNRNQNLPFASLWNSGNTNNLWGNRFSSNPWGSGFNPFTNGFSNPFQTNNSFTPFSNGFNNPFGGNSFSNFSNPFGNSFSNPFSNSTGFGGMGMPGMTPFSPMGGFPGMSPMGGFGMTPFSSGMSPFGGSSFMPRF